jgi:hypothetical protein
MILEIVSQVDIREFADIFFAMVEKNAFCSKTYATLFHRLQSKWAFFTEIFETKYRSYIDTFHTIVSVDPENYDLFCEWKALNDKRRTFTLFLVHATEMQAIPNSYYRDTVRLIMERIDVLLDSNDKDSMNEMVENLFLLKPKDHTQITQWTKLKPSDHVGLSYKIIFRLMDILK